MQTNTVTQDQINAIAKNFKENFPDKGFVITDENQSCSCHSTTLIDITGLRVQKFNKRQGQSISDDELKKEAFCWVYDSKSFTNSTERATYIREKFNEQMKKQYDLYVGVNNKESFKFAYVNHIAAAYFKGYNGDILIVLF